MVHRKAAFAAILVLSLLSGIAALAAANPYVGNKNSKKYHKVSCRFVKEMKPENRTEFPSIQAAEEAGYVACKVCKPAGKKKQSAKIAP